MNTVSHYNQSICWSKLSWPISINHRSVVGCPTSGQQSIITQQMIVMHQPMGGKSLVNRQSTNRQPAFSILFQIVLQESIKQSVGKVLIMISQKLAKSLLEFNLYFYSTIAIKCKCRNFTKILNSSNMESRPWSFPVVGF